MKRPVTLIAALLISSRALSAQADWNDAEPRRVVQPIQEYFAATIPYTHLGTAFGTMGPGEADLEWREGAICCPRLSAAWAGMWHQLSNGSYTEKGIDFRRCYPPWIDPRFQPRCEAVVVRARGTGQFKIEIQGSQNALLWSRRGEMNERDYREFRLPLPVSRLRQARTLSWVLESGAGICVDSVGLEIEYPDVSFSDRVFLLSYAKLARCFNPELGTIRDKAHLSVGAHDCVPASGLFALATCAAWKRGMVSREAAVATVHRVHLQMESVPSSRGLLPHFLLHKDGAYQILPGSEYSSVDTALYYLSMLLAAQILEEPSLVEDLERAIEAIEFDRLRNEAGFVSHGIRDDGTPLTSTWADWGGESALVLMLQAIADPRAPRKMDRSGRVYQGVGFIAEIQSLLFPQFSSSRRDSVSGVNWREARARLFDRQRAYFAADTPPGKLGVFGLSAGEGRRGEGYLANGVEQSGIELIHPHYMLLSWEHWERPAELYEVLRQMEQAGLLPPWGLVENVDADLQEYLPFHGALNASFECLSAYHLWASANEEVDVIYEAAKACPPIRRAMRAFYR